MRGLWENIVPTYFAYGANMDVAAMRQRCPASRPIGPARLMNHQFFIMDNGWASVRHAPGRLVHGLLWSLDPADMGALDRFEDLDGGLYRKITHPVVKPLGASQALIYVGQTVREGRPQPGYLEAILRSARTLGMPDGYLQSLAVMLPGGSPEERMKTDTLVGDPKSRPAVKPRFATPFDRD